ncbi:MAG: PEP-CTERM sorting domain-containing protein [Acetobacteraceae bacterium]|nr:PEP-CTERM sorting domain-containing protein [Acetobacteraceae bacterium]
MSPREAAKISAITLGIAVAGGMAGAHAAVISAMPDAALSSMAVPITFGSGAATYDFTAASTPYGPGATVETSGTALVSSLGGMVTDFAAGSTIDQTGELYSFSAFPTASVIPFSAADDYIGLAFTLGDGVHYGYAEVDGPTLVSYGNESMPGTSILTGATGPSPVPEPATAALLGVGLAGAALARQRRPRARRCAA